MIDYTFLFFLLFFFLWLYLMDMSYTRKEIVFSYATIGLSIPLLIYIANNSYINGFVFGYIFAFIPMILSFFSLSINITDLKGKR